jgi:glycosyltransferase involved in cell wall biosynthesis
MICTCQKYCQRLSIGGWARLFIHMHIFISLCIFVILQIPMKAIVSVINDLSTDQRVHKVCSSLQTMGYEVVLVGRKQRLSLPLQARSYRTKRMSLLFEKGPLFYAFFQFRLFCLLLFSKADVLVSNDLDTLLPNYLVSKIKGSFLVYDSHEIFCEVPELQKTHLKRKIWKGLERMLFPRLIQVFTVNESIAAIYKAEYGITLHVLRNVPLLSSAPYEVKSRADLGLPEDKKIVLLQGAGINVDRGAEEAVEAMVSLPDVVLLIIGNGDVIPSLHARVKELKMEERVRFIAKLTLDKDTNVNYRYSLPNKLFDYIHAGVPVLATNLVEVKKIVEQYQVGCIIPDLTAANLALILKRVLDDKETLKVWKENTKLAAENLCWEKESVVLKEVYGSLMMAVRKSV